MKRKIPFAILIFVIIGLFTACNVDELKEGYESQRQGREICSVTEHFNPDVLLSSGIPEVVTRAMNTTYTAAFYPENVYNIYVLPRVNSLSGTSHEITIVGEGNYTEDIPVMVTDFLNDELIWEGVIPGDGRMGGEVTFTLDEYFDNGDGYHRFIRFQYYASPIWHTITMIPQEPLENLFRTNIDLFIPAAGETYTITRRSSIPGNNEMASFRAIDPNDVELATAMIYPPFNLTGSLKIPENEGAEREIRIQYSLDGTITWITFERWVQVGVAGQTTKFIKEGHVYEIFPAGGGSSRMYLLAGQGTDLSTVQFRATSRTHVYYNPTGNTPIVLDGLTGTHTNLTYKGRNYDGYVEINVDAATPPPYNGWVHAKESYIGFNYKEAFAAYYIEYFNGVEWSDLGYIGQRAYWLRIYESTPILNSSGGLWRLKMVGLAPDGKVLFKAALADSHTNDVCYGSPSMSPILTDFLDSAVVEINISENRTGQERLIYLWYSIDGGNTWSRCNPNDPLLEYWHFPANYPVRQASV